MEVKQENLSSPTTPTVEPTPSPSSSEESKPKLSDASPISEPDIQAAAIRAELDQKAAAAKERREKRNAVKGSAEAANNVRKKRDTEEKPKRGPKARVIVDDEDEEEVEIESFDEEDVKDFLDITDEFFVMFKLEPFTERAKKRLSKPLTRIVKKRVNKRVKKFSDEMKVGMIIFGKVIESLNIGKQSRNAIRHEGAREDNVVAFPDETRKAADSR